MAKKKESIEQEFTINSFTIDVIDKHIRNFLIRTKNEEKKVDDIIESIDNFRKNLQSETQKILEENGCKIGEKIPEDKVEEINKQYGELLNKQIKIDKDSLSKYTEEEFNTVTDGLVLTYQHLKLLKYWLIKKESE